MKQRVISAIIAATIIIPFFIIGGLAFDIVFYVLTILGLREFMKAKAQEKKYPNFIRLISYIMISMLYYSNLRNSTFDLYIDYRIVSGIFLVLLLPVVLYHDDKIYNVKDAFYLLGGIFFLGCSMTLFGLYRSISLQLLIFLFSISIITDSYAYFVGKLIGRHKLLEVISPNKTWEGTIGGSLIATFVCTIIYLTIVNQNASVFPLVIIVLFLSFVGQFGDLFFSSIKRAYKIKDFSNIMPGHGGILDRLDSIVFVMLTYLFFLNIL